MLSAALKNTGYSQQIARSRLDHIYLVRGHSEAGQPVWFYLMVDPGKLAMFKSKRDIPQLNLADYGQVLYSGVGHNPSELVKWLMDKQYDFRE